MKKKILSVLIVLFVGSILNAQSVNFIDGSWGELKDKANAEKKNLYIDCYTEWCGPCKLLEKNTFHDPAVSELMNTEFVSARIDMEKDYGINIAMKYRVNGFPTALIFNPEGKLIYRIFGYAEPKKYIELIKKGLDPANQIIQQGVSDKVDLDYPQFYKDIFAGNGKRKWPDEKAVSDFLDHQEDLFSEISWDIVKVCDAGDKYRKHFLSNVDNYRKLYGTEVDDKIYSILNNDLYKAIKEKNEINFKECLDNIDKYIVSDKDNLEQSYKLAFYSGIEDWKNFAKEFEIYIDREKYSNISNVNQYCWNIYEKCNDPDIIAKACGWMNEALKFDSQYAYVDTYACLLYKNKNYIEAEKAAILAIKIGRDADEDVKSTEELLNKIKSSKSQ